MRLFIDSASLKEIEAALHQGAIDGVTTNPSLIAKEGKGRDELIRQICDLVKAPVSAEVLSVDEEGMIEEGRRLAEIHPSVVVKVPLTKAGLRASARLSQEKIPTNVTLCFSPLQALMAAKAGARYVSVFMGRLDDIGHRGAEIAAESHELLSNYGFKTEVLAASVRHPQHILETALGAVPIATAPYKVLMRLLEHPLTDIGLDLFLKAAGRPKPSPQ